MTDREILEKIAYFEYLKLKNLLSKDFENNPLRDWHRAEKIFTHFTNPSNWRDPFWRIDDEDYKEYKYLFADRLENGRKIGG